MLTMKQIEEMPVAKTDSDLIEMVRKFGDLVFKEAYAFALAQRDLYDDLSRREWALFDKIKESVKEVTNGQH